MERNHGRREVRRRMIGVGLRCVRGGTWKKSI